MNNYPLKNKKSARSISIVIATVFLSGCYLGMDTQLGHRSLPNPENNAIKDLSKSVPAALRISNVPLQVCMPVMEASDPRGLLTSNGDYKGVFQQHSRTTETLVQKLLIRGLREAGVQAKPLNHHCEYAFFRGSAKHYLRTEILHFETNIDKNGTAAVALGLNLTVWKKGGHLLFTGRHGGGAYGTQNKGNSIVSSKSLFSIAMRRLLNNVAQGRIGEVLR